MPSQFTLPPGPKGLPVLGNVPQFRRDPLSFVSGVQRAYGDVATVHILNTIGLLGAGLLIWRQRRLPNDDYEQRY